jgi:proteinaceous RNase P
VLHQGRLKGPRDAAANSLLQRLRAEKSLYATPYGSNDDWYWLYAAVQAGEGGCAVCGA